MESLDLWDFLSMDENIQNLEKKAFEDINNIIFHNANMFPSISSRKYVVFLLDIKDSTTVLQENSNSSRKILDFLKTSLYLFYFITSNLKLSFYFKPVGDGFIFLLPILEDSKNFIKVLLFLGYHTLIKYTKSPKPNIKGADIGEYIGWVYLNLLKKTIKIKFDYRLVGGYGNLICIEIARKNTNPLVECTGCPISYLVKKSKEVDTYKWFGEITPEMCRELLNS